MVNFQEAHTGLSSDASTIFVGTIHVIASLVGTLLVDRLGRKLLLLTSIIMMTISLIALGTFFYIRDTNQSHAESISWLPLLSLCTFIISFALGFGPIPFMMLSEIYSKEINAIASPLTGFFTWILAFALTSAFGPIAHVIGIAFSFWILGAFCIVGAVFILFMVPETKGKSLSQIQNMLQNNRFFLRVK